MIINSLNLNQLRIFNSVYANNSMTLAAKELGLTQSGISQHIKTLEATLESRLFYREKQRLHPTHAATLLYDQCNKGFNEIELALRNIVATEPKLHGVVKLGIPIDFGKNIILPLLKQFSDTHPLIKFEVKIGFANEINDLILNKTIDFAFVDNFFHNTKIQFLNVYSEALKLYIHKSLYNKHKSKKIDQLISTLDFIAYNEGCPVIHQWCDYHLHSVTKIKSAKAVIMDTVGVSEFILLGMGIGVLPEHHVLRLGKKKASLVCLDVKKKPLLNHIGIAYLKDMNISLQAKKLIEFLKDKIDTTI